jgi:hypothetical protein
MSVAGGAVAACAPTKGLRSAVGLSFPAPRHINGGRRSYQTIVNTEFGALRPNSPAGAPPPAEATLALPVIPAATTITRQPSPLAQSPATRQRGAVHRLRESYCDRRSISLR